MAIEEIKNFSLTFMSLPDLIKKIQMLLSANVGSKFFVNITVKQKKRSLPANAAYNAWLPAISDFMALTIPEARRYTKLEFGLPILLADDYLGSIIGNGLNQKGFFQMSYEDRLVEMERLPVTRLFDTKMHNKLRDDIQHFYEVQGLTLDYQK